MSNGTNRAGGSSRSGFATLLRNHANNLGANGLIGQGTGQAGSGITVADYQKQGDWTDDNNPNVVKWQGQTDDKSANYLAKIDKTTDLSAYQQKTNDPYSFYDNPYQKMVVNMGLNKMPTTLSTKDFNAYVKATGATVLYRGVSGDDAYTRFMTSPNSHVGNGINGDGYYFAPDIYTAKNYGGTGIKAALSPNARVISVDAVKAAIRGTTGKFNAALHYAGSKGTRTFGANIGDAQMAIKMGYNVIDAGWAVIPLTRDAVVVQNRKAWG